MDQFLHQDLIVGLDYNALELQAQGSKKSQILMFPQSQKIPDLSVTQNSRLLVGLSHFWISIAPLQVCFSTPKSGFWFLVVVVITYFLLHKRSRGVDQNSQKMLCYLHCYHSIFFTIDHTRCQKLKFTGAASIKRSDSPAAQNTTDLQNAEKRWTADELREALLLHLEKPSAAPLLNLQFTFLSSLGCTKCQKDRKWRFFTVWELNSYWCKDWSWTSTKRWNHSLFQRGKGLVCFQYNLKPITLSNACILRDGKRTLDDTYVIFLHLWIEKQWLVHIS